MSDRLFSFLPTRCRAFTKYFATSRAAPFFLLPVLHATRHYFAVLIFSLFHTPLLLIFRQSTRHFRRHFAFRRFDFTMFCPPLDIDATRHAAAALHRCRRCRDATRRCDAAATPFSEFAACRHVLPSRAD